jgi:hypothetical protein
VLIASTTGVYGCPRESPPRTRPAPELSGATLTGTGLFAFAHPLRHNVTP